MSLAREGVRERGTWRGIAALVIVLAVPFVPSGESATASRGLGKRTTARWGQDPPSPKRKDERAPKPKPRPKTVEQMIRDEWGDRSDEALRVAHCESKLDPDDVSSAGATGVFQIMPVHTWRVRKVGGKHLADPLTNVRVARSLYEDEGWRPWTCARIVGLTA
jgi:soluble lytic murein transglycosylase-like protein